MADQPRVLIVGDYDQGAFGPTILLKLTSTMAVKWLYDRLSELAEGPDAALDLAAAPEVRIRGVRSLHLRRVDHATDTALDGPTTVIPDADFVWSQDADGWRFSAGLIDAFSSGRAGHQYMTKEGRDVALIEVSFEEPTARIAQ